jgi:tetratricopeptide (TPR) repeat protein
MSQVPNPAVRQQVASLLALATKSLSAGRPADAIVPLREASLLEPFNPIIQHDLGLACLEVGSVTDAIAALQWAVASNPRYADAHFRLGIALEKQGDINGAIAAYDRATQLTPSVTEAWFRAGALVYELGHREEAIGCFHRAAATGGKTSFGRLGKARALLTEIFWAIFSRSSAVSTRPANASNARSRSHRCWRDAITIWSAVAPLPAMTAVCFNAWKPP